MKILLCAHLLLLIADCFSQRLMLENQTAVQFSDASIPCNYDPEAIENPPEKIVWYSVQTNPQRLYIMYPNPEDGISAKDPDISRDLSVNEMGALLLPNVTLNDNRDYSTLQCEVDFGQPGNVAASLTFTVVALPEQDPRPMLNEASFDPSGTTKVLVGSCTSGSGYPTPIIEILRNGQVITRTSASADGVVVDTTDPASDELLHDFEIDDHPNGTFSVISRLHVTLNVSDDKAEFICRVKSGLGSDTRIQEVPFPILRVNHPVTQVNIAVSENTPHAIVGQPFVLTCEANGYPEPVITIDGQQTDTFNRVITKNDVDRSITCEAGGVRSAHALNVLYAEKPMVDGSTTTDLGISIDLRCRIDSNPPANSITWMKGKEVVEGDGVSFLRDSASFEDSGEYTCMIENGFPSLDRTSDPMQLTVNGIIVHDPADEKVTGALKETVTLECKVSANPMPSFLWKKSDNSTVESTMEKKEDDYKYVAQLEVGPLDHTMSLDTIQCIVSNGVSPSMTKDFILPELQAQQAGASPAIIIVVILLVLLILAVILAVLYRKGIICKKTGKGDETAEDISVQVSKKDVEKGEEGTAENDANGQKEDEKSPEQEALMKENGDK